jgi:hypothetical protein
VGGHRGKIVFTQPSGAWEKGAHCATLMATRGGVLDPRARGGGATIYRRPTLAKAVRESSLQHGRGVRRHARPSTAATRVDERQHGRRGMATARAARGARGVGEEGGAVQGGPTARTDGPRPASPCGPSRAAARRRATPACALECQGARNRFNWRTLTKFYSKFCN